MGNAGELAYQVAPRGVDVVLNAAYKLFPDSHAARGDRGDSAADRKEQPSTESVAFAHRPRHSPEHRRPGAWSSGHTNNMDVSPQVTKAVAHVNVG